MRICPECESRELDKFKQKCSECRQASIDHNLAKSFHTYSNTEKGKATIKAYQRKYHRERYKTDPEYREKVKERSREYNKKRRQQVRKNNT